MARSLMTILGLSLSVAAFACAEVTSAETGGTGGTGDTGGTGGTGGGTGGTGDVGGTGGEDNSVSCFADSDDDDYPAESDPMLFEGSCGAGYIEARGDSEWDCHDDETRIHPDQEMYFDIGSAYGWDFNCDGVDERQYVGTTPFSCASGCAGAGWIGGVPNCGAPGNLATCIMLDGCAQMAATASQACR